MTGAPQSVVVVGHGLVGHRFVEALRDRDREGRWQITVLCEESTPAYDRVALSSYVDGWDRSALAMAGNDYAGDDLVQLRVGERASAIDRDARTVTTSSGLVIDYDAVVLATGSYPFVPPIPGKDLERCFVYRTLDDLDAIRAVAEVAGPGATGIVVGGGLLGLEAANALRLMGLTPHVVELAPRLMPVQVDEGGGAVLAGIVTQMGLHVHTGVSTTAIENCAGGLRATLSDGQTIEAAVLVFSAGVRPRDELARGCGLDVGERGGVVTDIACRTSDPDIRAIGEVAAIEGCCYGSSRRAMPPPRSWRTGCLAGRPNSPVRTCPRSSSCSVSTSPASAMRTQRPKVHWRSSSTTRRRAPTPNSLSTTMPRHCSAGSSSVMPAPTARCARSSGSDCRSIPHR